MMPQNRRLNYHSVFDPGNAAILFPLKEPRFAREKREEFERQMRNILQFNLLWRPSLVVRHIDLFNNVPLMTFMRSDEAAMLCSHGMLRVIVPHVGDFSRIFQEWAFGPQSQHFHHLSSEEQAAYDAACRKGKLQSPEQAEDLLLFSRYGLNLAENLRDYDFLFKGLRETLRWNPPAEEYPKRVLELWEKILQNPRRTAPHSADTIKRIDAEIRLGANEGWRRRQFFTNLERLEGEVLRGDRDLQLMRDVKLAAVNRAFYDELELLKYSQEDSSAPIWVTRDHSLISQVAADEEAGNGLADSAALREEVEPMHAIPLKYIIGWHTDGVLSGDFPSYSSADILPMIRRHVDILNKCVKKTIKDNQHKDKDLQYLQNQRQTTTLEAYAPEWGSHVQTGINAALGLAAVFTPGKWGIGIVTTAVIEIMLKFKTKTRRWKRSEAILKTEMESQLKERVDLSPPFFRYPQI